MKNFKIKFFTLCVLLLLPTIAWAASDFYLKLGDVKGEFRTVKCTNGVCVVPALEAGDYTVQVSDARGKVSMQDMSLMYSVVGPRDSASGMATGKRQHQSLTISKTLDRETAPGNVIAIDEAGSQVAIGTTDANVDAGLAKISKSRSNIQNN